MLANCSVDGVTLSSNLLTRVQALLLWIETGILTNVYDNSTTSSSKNPWTTTLLMTYKNAYLNTPNAWTVTKLLTTRLNPKPGQFYILPKIHKQGNPGRPTVSSNSHPTERISQFVDYHLKPLVQTTQSFIKDTTHFLNKLEQLGQLPQNALLVTLDVSSLYTNIPHNELPPADISLTHATAIVLLLVQRLSVTSYVWFSQWTASHSTTNTTYRYTVQPWEPEWRLLTPICSSPNLRQTLYHVLLTSHTHGGVT